MITEIYFTLEKYLTPIIDRFAIKPDKDFARYLFGISPIEKVYLLKNGEIRNLYFEPKGWD